MKKRLFRQRPILVCAPARPDGRGARYSTRSLQRVKKAARSAAAAKSSVSSYRICCVSSLTPPRRMEPSTAMRLPLWKYLQTNSAVWRQTTMSIKSALRSSPARTKLRSTAIRNVHVATPFGVWRSSGSATRRPIKATTFSIILPPFQLSRERLLLSPRSWNAARRR